MTTRMKQSFPAAGRTQESARATSTGRPVRGSDSLRGRAQLQDEAVAEPRAPRPVMLVDDDLDLLRLAKTALERAGFQVDARAEAPTWDDLQRVHPAVVFMDIELKGENGVDICQAIKTNGRAAHLPIILISGHGADRLKDEAERCKADGFLSKPFSTKLLVKLAEHYTKLAAEPLPVL